MKMRALSLGVLATLSTFLLYFVHTSIVKSLGMMLVDIQNNLGADTWMLGSVFALFDCVKDILAPLAGPIGRRFGSRPVVMAGGVMVTAGLIGASQARNVLQLFLALVVLTATGCSVVNVLVRAELGKHFDDRNFALVSGIAQTGASISLVTQPPLIQLFLNTYGWRGTLLLVASISAHLAVCGALLFPSSTMECGANTERGYKPLMQTTREPSRLEGDKHGTFASMKSSLLSVAKAFDLSLMMDSNFWIIAFIYVVARTTRGAWIIYFVPYAVAKGIENEAAAVMLTAAGLGQMSSIVLVSVALFKGIITSTSAMVVTIVVISTSFLIEPWMVAGWMISANAVMFLAGMGWVFSLGEVMLKEFLGYERMANAIGWIGLLSGLFRFISGFVPGWLYDHSGSYDLGFVILGTLQMMTLVPLLAKILRQKYCGHQA